MSIKKIIIFCATGDQGASTCKYLVEDGGFEVYGITRNPDSDKSKAIEKLGVKLVKGNMEDPSSYAPHLEGMYGAFINADFWSTYFSNGLDAKAAGMYESQSSRNAFDACVKAGIDHIIYSTLDDLPDDVTCEHIKSKAGVSKYIKAKNVPATHFYTSTYFSNLTKFYQLEKHDDGSATLTWPVPDSTLLVSFAVEQTGAWILAAFKDPAKWKGKEMEACGEIIRCDDLAKVLSEVSGKKVESLHMTEDEFYSEGLKKKITEELWINYRMFHERQMVRDVAASKAVNPKQWGAREWAQNSQELKQLLGF